MPVRLKQIPELDTWRARIEATKPELLAPRAERQPPDKEQPVLFEPPPLSRAEVLTKLADEELERRRQRARPQRAAASRSE
jgi:hypothetical protein